MTSYSQVVKYRCGACGHPGERQTWLVIDDADEPRLADDVRAGRLRSFTCDNCGAQVPRTTSLLLASGRRSPLLFAPDPAADARRTQEQLMASLMMVSRGKGDGDGHFPPVVPISHELLPVAAQRDVDDDLAAWRAHTWAADTVELQRYGEWLAQVGHAKLLADVKEAVGELTAVHDDAGFAALVRRRPELLTDEADGLLQVMQKVVDTDAPVEYQRAVEHWRHLLRLCRRDGVEAVFRQAGEAR